MKIESKSFNGVLHRVVPDEQNGIFWYIFDKYRTKRNAKVTQVFKNKLSGQTIVGVGYALHKELQTKYNL